ncbi:FAD/NAD(P)-binding protein [Aeromonas cavernicola]|uniref:Adhesin n=1 Tax=Aeromonas cavernicola TaxID=1006623 RepID=A0A2H9U6F7_9GAMM|nr:FAD/NAD(P)-binding protein [Aeromonas cavernicola]PJG59582.1 adhesin [Aeromonas cavernicola]
MVTNKLTVAIVGLGSRGLSLLERLLTLAPLQNGRQLAIHIFEPNKPGCGVHDPQQHDYLLLNTVAEQLSMFPSHAANGSPFERLGPNLYEWCLERGIRIAVNGHQDQVAGRLVLPTDFLPRSLLGGYLHWFYQEITANLADNISLTLHQERAVALDYAADAAVLYGESGSAIRVDKLFLMQGHTGQMEQPLSAHHIVNIYPIPASLAPIAPQDEVGLEGFGLASMDVLAALSTGRGGVFVRQAGQPVVYLASGQEPNITLFSRTGLPFRVRPDTGSQRVRHRPLFLTEQAIASLRARRSMGQLNLEQDLLPLLLDEMKAAYYLTLVSAQHAPSAAVWRNTLTAAVSTGTLAESWNLLERLMGKVDLAALLLRAVPAAHRGEGYSDWVKAFINEDLAMGQHGLEHSADKAALEVWRDMRDSLRSVIDFAGLDDASHRAFFQEWAPLINRMVAGPQKERYQDLIALIEAGIVTLAAPGTRFQWSADSGKFHADQESAMSLQWLISARQSKSLLKGSSDRLLRCLSDKGYLSEHVGLRQGELRIDQHYHPIDAQGVSLKRIWLLGPLLEGATYYNHYVPSAGGYSRALSEAQQLASDCLDLPHWLAAVQHHPHSHHCEFPS